MRIGGNIGKIFRILVVLLPVILALSGCSKDGFMEKDQGNSDAGTVDKMTSEMK